MTGETCWFCKKAAPDPAAACQTPMYGDFKTDAVLDGGVMKRRTRWSNASIAVPRCPDCKAFHERRAKTLRLRRWALAAVGFTLFVVVGGLSYLLGGHGALGNLIVSSVILFGLSAFPLRAWYRANVRDQADRHALGTEELSFRKQYPQVSDLLTAGWRIRGRA